MFFSFYFISREFFFSEQFSSNEPPRKLIHYEQFSNSRNRPLSKFSIENTTPNIPVTSSIGVDTSGITKKRFSAETANAAILSRKRRTITKLNQGLISNENLKQGLLSDRINQSSSDIIIDQIDDELLRRLSQGNIKISTKRKNDGRV